MLRGHTQLPMAHPTTMGPWLTGIISNLSGMSTHLLMAYFLPPHASLQRKKARESGTLGSASAFSPLSFPKHPLLSPQDHSWFLNSHQVSGEGEILFLALFVGKVIDAICLPLFCPPSGLDPTGGRNEGVRPVVSHVLWTTLSLQRDAISETVPIYLEYCWQTQCSTQMRIIECIQRATKKKISRKKRLQYLD